MYYKEEIVALEPIYCDGLGDCTKVHLNNGDTEIESIKIPTILKNMAKEDLVDMAQVHQIIKRFLTIRKSLPYVFNQDYIYIGIKTRKPLCKNDGTQTFVNLKQIDKHRDGILYLKNGDKIRVLDDKTTIRRKINNGILCGMLIEDRKRFVKI
ncbi:MAG: hypothetical protein Q4E02_01325 [Lagierella massiliensis]|nr:hypothetical protein [Lagierella massiliensis]